MKRASILINVLYSLSSIYYFYLIILHGNETLILHDLLSNLATFLAYQIIIIVPHIPRWVQQCDNSLRYFSLYSSLFCLPSFWEKNRSMNWVNHWTIVEYWGVPKPLLGGSTICQIHKESDMIPRFQQDNRILQHNHWLDWLKCSSQNKSKQMTKSPKVTPLRDLWKNL